MILQLLVDVYHMLCFLSVSINIFSQIKLSRAKPRSYDVLLLFNWTTFKSWLCDAILTHSLDNRKFLNAVFTKCLWINVPKTYSDWVWFLSIQLICRTIEGKNTDNLFFCNTLILSWSQKKYMGIYLLISHESILTSNVCIVRDNIVQCFLKDRWVHTPLEKTTHEASYMFAIFNIWWREVLIYRTAL